MLREFSQKQLALKVKKGNKNLKKIIVIIHHTFQILTKANEINPVNAAIF